MEVEDGRRFRAPPESPRAASNLSANGMPERNLFGLGSASTAAPKAAAAAESAALLLASA